jgi:hypothetical protein
VEWEVKLSVLNWIHFCSAPKVEEDLEREEALGESSPASDPDRFNDSFGEDFSPETNVAMGSGSCDGRDEVILMSCSSPGSPQSSSPSNFPVFVPENGSQIDL